VWCLYLSCFSACANDGDCQEFNVNARDDGAMAMCGARNNCFCNRPFAYVTAEVTDDFGITVNTSGCYCEFHILVSSVTASLCPLQAHNLTHCQSLCACCSTVKTQICFDGGNIVGYCPKDADTCTKQGSKFVCTGCKYHDWLLDKLKLPPFLLASCFMLILTHTMHPLFCPLGHSLLYARMACTAAGDDATPV
jgi:hypothetical protein